MGEQLGRFGQFEIDHLGDSIEVEAARGHVGGHQDFYLGRAKLSHHAVAGVLAHIALQGLGRVTGSAQLFGQLFGSVLGTGEDDGEAVPLVEQLAQMVPTRLQFDLVNDVVDFGLLLGGGVDLNPYRVVQEGGRRTVDPARMGCREQGRLALGRRGRMVKNRLDVVHEALVQHLVGLI